MTDLNNKQAFWAEQLPLFKEKYWLPEHLDVLEFNMDGGCFEIPVDVKIDLSEDDLFDIYHRVNSGWVMWKKAVTFMQEKAKAQAVQQSFEIGRLQDRITELLDERQDLYAQINNDQAVPDTHIVVPKQPTPKMIDATWDFDEEIIEMSSNTRNEFIWKKMVEASESGAEG